MSYTANEEAKKARQEKGQIVSLVEAELFKLYATEIPSSVH